MDYELDFLKALAFTIIIETGVLWSLLNMFFKKPETRFKVIILAGITASLATLPYLWFILPLFLKVKVYYITVSEIAAVIMESFILYGILRTSYKNALMLSAACNLVSFLTGMLIIP